MPLTVTAVGGRHIFPRRPRVRRPRLLHVRVPRRYQQVRCADRDPNKKIVVTYSSINGNGFGGYGEIVMGTKGTLALLGASRRRCCSTTSRAPATKVGVDGKGGALDTTASGGAGGRPGGDRKRPRQPRLHGRDRALGLVHPQPVPENTPRCHPKVALADAVIALTTNIALPQSRTRANRVQERVVRSQQ